MIGLIKWPGMFFLPMCLVASGCSPSPSKKPDATGNVGYGTMGDMVQCTTGNCNPGQPQLYVNGMSTPRLTADVNQPVNWQITARSTMYSGRSYAAIRLNFNPAMPRLTVRQSTGTVSGGDAITVNGQLTAADLQSSGTATVVVRDMTACQVLATGSNSGGGSSACTSASQTSQYDTTLTATVSFTNNTYNPYSPNSAIPGGTTMANNGPDLATRIGIAAALGGLQALFGQNNSPTGVLGGAVNGAITGLNQGTYVGGTSNMYNGSAYYNPNSYQPNSGTNSSYNNGTNYIRGY